MNSIYLTLPSLLLLSQVLTSPAIANSSSKGNSQLGCGWQRADNGGMEFIPNNCNPKQKITEVDLPSCPISNSAINKNLFTTNSQNYKKSTSSQGSFLLDASTRQADINKNKFIKLLELANQNKLGNGSADMTNEVKCLNYFLKRSNLTKCVDLNIQIPENSSTVRHFPFVKTVYRCSPDSSIFIIRSIEDNMESTFILDPLRKMQIRAVDARYQNPDFYASVTGDKHLYTGNTFMSPPVNPPNLEPSIKGAKFPGNRYGWRAYEGNAAHGFLDVMGDDNSIIFEGSPFWGNIFTISLLNIFKGESASNSIPPEQQIGLTLQMCNHSCLVKAKESMVTKGIFLRPDGFWFNLEDNIRNYPDGLPAVKSVAQGSEAFKEGIRPGMLISRVGDYSPSGMPRAVSIESVRENLLDKNSVKFIIWMTTNGKPSTEKVEWFRSWYN